MISLVAEMIAYIGQVLKSKLELLALTHTSAIIVLQGFVELFQPLNFQCM